MNQSGKKYGKNDKKKMKIGNRVFDLNNECYVMGILNVTPDSFSDGGKWNEMDAALKRVEEMISEGCDILDIGGESTRPGHQQISEEEEAERVVPVIEAVKKRFDIPISLDTYKAVVAEAGVASGIDMINDIWGCQWESIDDKKTMAQVMADADIPVVLMHNRNSTDYDDYLSQVMKELGESVKVATEAGVKKENIILDPGIGFGKTYEQNLKLMNHLEIMNGTGLPWLLGTSRKSMIGLTLDLPADQRLEGTLATTVIGMMKGCSIVRVHDIKENVRTIKMVQAILDSK